MTVRRYARRPDRPDVRDVHYRPAALGLLATAPPARTDLRGALPPAFDQGAEGSCGPCSASALMCLLHGTAPRSRQQIYYCVRVLENTVHEDSGVETRDLFKVLQKTGAAPETSWRYSPGNLYHVPPASVLMAARECRISSYSRLIGEDDFISCLAEGLPFVLGFEVFDSLEDDEVSRTGVWRVPDTTRERSLGGHDVLVVGYDTNFRASEDLARSGIDPSTVEDHALLIRNSWGAEWGIQGHFWMPMSLAVNPSIGGDAWTGRR